jgi:selenocysteine lyase/cysteine desulfurase
MSRIAEYERTLSSALLDAIEAVPGARVHGVSDRARLAERVPTVCFTVDGVESSAIATALAEREIGVRFGHMYTPRLMSRLGLLPGGVVRASLAHYNTVDEIGRFAEALAAVV